MKLHPEIEQLLLEKTYSQLNISEREKVDLVFDSQTYEQYRLVLLAAQQLKKETPAPPSELESQLLAAFERQFPVPRVSIFRRFTRHQSPTWLTAGLAASICLLVGFFLFRNPVARPVLSPQIVYQTDTIFVERPMLARVQETTPTVNENQKKEKTSGRRVSGQSIQMDSQQISKLPITPPKLAVNVPIPNPEKSSSIQNDPGLLDLVVKVY